MSSSLITPVHGIWSSLMASFAYVELRPQGKIMESLSWLFFALFGVDLADPLSPLHAMAWVLVSMVPHH
jgi:hypothetical protein